MEFSTFQQEVEAALARDGDPELSHLDDAALETEFRVQSAQLAAATCRWLLLLAELVTRGVWAAQGARTPTEWLSWAVSMAPSTAREHVRVALRLRDFPEVTERFARGELSYSKVRAITRCGRPELTRLLLSYAAEATGAQLEAVVRGFRGARLRAHDRVDPYEARDLRVVERDDGTAELRIRLPLEECLATEARLSYRAEQLRREALAARDPEGDTPLPTHRQLKADALLEAVDRLAASAPDTSGAARHTLVLHVEADALAAPAPGRDPRTTVRASAEARHRSLSVRTLRRLACDARLAIVGHDPEGCVDSVSGETRRVPPRLRRLLLARDRGCRFPSCTARRGLHAHHIIHWADGGPTELSNLVLLCPFHHRFVHERGWELLHDGRGHFRFQPPGEPVIPTVAPPRTLDPLAAVEPAERDPLEFDPRSLQPDWDGSRPDIQEAVAVLFDELDRLAPPPGVAVAA